MEILITIGIILLCIFIVLGIIFLYLYFKLKASIKGLGISKSEFMNMIKEGEEDSKYRHKSISGMSNLLLPRIIKDFPNFSESELYSKVETSLLAIFHSLEDGYVQKKVELNIIKSNLESKILDLKNSNTKVRFEDIVFHKHAIKGYEKTYGVLIITVATSLEYYYSREKDGKLVDEYREYKKQTSYTTRFIYVYDPEKYEKTSSLVGIHCPNCGSPVKELSNKHCSYCGSGLEDINLKSWFISEYKEDK